VLPIILCHLCFSIRELALYFCAQPVRDFSDHHFNVYTRGQYRAFIPNKRSLNKSVNLENESCDALQKIHSCEKLLTKCGPTAEKLLVFRNPVFGFGGVC
jgi:hypothetical protein